MSEDTDPVPSAVDPPEEHPLARRDRRKQDARRQAAVQRAAERTGTPNRDLARERREALAGLTPSAARVLVHSPAGPRSVDPVVTALAFARGILSLQGAGSDDARARASLVHRALRTPIATEVPSGLTLAEALRVDPASVPEGEHDGAITVAEHLTAAGRSHEDGEIDLYARVAPMGLDRHPRADEVDIVCSAVLSPEVADDDARPRLVLVTDDGWLEVWPPAAMEARSRGVLAGVTSEVVGEGLYRWLTGPQADAVASSGPDALPDLFGGADIRALVRTASQRAGADHARLAGPVLLEMLAPPAA